MEDQKTQQQQNFPPDFNKRLYAITIEVFENASTLRISWPKAEGSFQPTTHHIIGVLETQKASFILTQSELVQPAYAIFRAEQEEKRNQQAEKTKTEEKPPAE